MTLRVLKWISKFLLLFAGLIVTAHSVIPHDHHFSDTFNRNGNTCPLSDQNPDHHSGFPVHCHAFNDLTSEKILINVIPDKAQINKIGLSNSFTYYTPYLQLIVSRVGVFSETIPDFAPEEYSSLRAPPHLG